MKRILAAPVSEDLIPGLREALGSAYTIERELGGGGMARVFLATDTRLERQVVIKVLSPELAAGISAGRFAREIKFAAQLQEPHIVPVLADGATADGLPYYTMPFVRGASLRQRMAEGAIPLSEARTILADIARALAYAHGRGVVHRDIKPENILLHEGTAVVTDFGIAKAVSASKTQAPGGTITQVGTSLGTPAYMAPEQALGDEIDGRADIYSWGVLAYEMLAGCHPFASKATMQQMIAAHISEVPSPLPRDATLAALAQLVMRTLAKDPAERPESAAALLAELNVATSGDTLSRGPEAMPSHSRRRQALVAGALAAAIVAAVAVGAVLMKPGTAATSELTARRVAVAPFENLTGDPAFDQVGRVAADWLSQGIAQADSVDVVSSSMVSMVMGDGKAPAGDLVRHLAEATRAGYVVTGSVLRRRDSLVLQAQLVNARTGITERILGPATSSIEDPIAAIDGLRDRLISALVLDESTRDVLKTMRPPRYSAYREFVTGVERFARYSDWAGSRPYFERAIALDSSFGAAHSYLFASYANTDDWNTADSLFRIAERFREQLSPSEQAMLAYRRESLRGDLEAQLRSVQYAARDSGVQALYLIGFLSNELLRPRVALPALAAADSFLMMFGWAPQVRVFAEAYHQAGAHDRELATLVRGRRRFPANGAIAGAHLRAYAALGQPEPALALADTILGGITDSLGGSVGWVLTGANEFRAHGDSASSERLARKALAWYAAHPLRDPQPARLFSEGLAYFALGRLDSAARRFASATKDTTLLDAAGYLALVHVARGDTMRAVAIGDSLAAIGQRRRWLFGAHTLWRAAITGAVGDRERALELFRQAQSEGVSMAAWHYERRYHAMRGYAPFEALIRPQR